MWVSGHAMPDYSPGVGNPTTTPKNDDLGSEFAKRTRMKLAELRLKTRSCSIYVLFLRVAVPPLVAALVVLVPTDPLM